MAEEKNVRTADSFYARAGVDQRLEDATLAKMLDSINPTIESRRGRIGEVQLSIGFFANVIKCGPDLGVAATTDSVGTKALIAQALDKYDTIGIDCIATNVNDVLCVGAEPLTVLDFIAIALVNERMMLELARGLAAGARTADVSISGGEIAQVGSMIRGIDDNRAFDLMGSCFGVVPLSRIIAGQEIRPNDLVVSLASTGLHCNGLSLARTVLERSFSASLDTMISDLGRTLGEELLHPSGIYVREVLAALRSGANITGLAHISGGGLWNLTRCGKGISYVIDALPEPPAVFRVVQQAGKLLPSAMFHALNMGVGFCLVVRPDDVSRVLDSLRAVMASPAVIGRVIADTERRVFLPGYKVHAREGTFWEGCEIPV